ncbi:MAG: diguanylate cyclase [Clostridiales bacterium]|nr:diguanylate cyclase [Clostridiales bacterium]
MDYKAVPFEKRIKENIRNYSLDHLYHIDTLTEYLKALCEVADLEILLTERHGEKVVSVGGFAGFTPDVVEEPGRKVRVYGRTIAHLYAKTGKVSAQKLSAVERLLDELTATLSQWAEEAYLHTESSIYLDELEEKMGVQHVQTARGEKEDALTGVYHKLYFEERMKIIDRAEIAPVAVINVNINDWKFVNDHFGDEESDRLIKTIADILKREAKPDYVIGRVDGDVFITLIPMAEEGEAEEYCDKVQSACLGYEDSILAPSVACGVVYKTNVEELLEDKLPDAEYEMFHHKFEVKNAAGYRERLEHGLKRQEA